MKLLILLTALGLLSSCDWMPGKPDPAHKWVPDTEIKDFDALYSVNCRGCHAIDQGLAAAHQMDDFVYLATIPQDTFKALITNGIPGTAMPSFSIEKGGTLTDEQIDIIVSTLYQRYSRPQLFAGVPIPPYSAPLGNVAAGAQAYQTFCASCHGADGAGGDKGGSIVDPTYLSLVSDQALRTAVIAGRNDLGMPDWRGYVAGKTMSDAEISDVVAWLASKRPALGSPTAQPPVEAASTPVNP